MILERYELASKRIEEIQKEKLVPEPFCNYFKEVAEFIHLANTFYSRVKDENYYASDIEQLQEDNKEMYRDILPDYYQGSYGNPAYACEKLGDSLGAFLSFLYVEVRGLIVYAVENRIWDMTVVEELFLEIYQAFREEELPTKENIRTILYWYVSDYSEEMIEYRVKELVDPNVSFAKDIIMKSDLQDLRYLYRFGEYITENEVKTATFLNGLTQEEIDKMASTYTEGYRIGFENNNIDLSKKKVVNIRYNLGFERMVKAAILQFEKMGLSPTIYRAATHSVDKRQHLRIGYYGAIANKQFDYDHRGDAGLYLDEDFIKRKIRVLQNAYEKEKEWAFVHAGPAVIEIFGEKPFVPVSKEACITLSGAQQKLQVAYDNQASQITNRYIKGEERSFTIIAFPTPEIGEEFEEIFKETVKINTLDYKKYEAIQQSIIDALDQGTKVHIKGINGNDTDLLVELHSLSNSNEETIFENCVADVNIPVGEVFTSPVLQGTRGTLHVSSVYLNELRYENLKMVFEEGRIKEYSCSNFHTKEENESYIKENILHHHESLPLGEFAIGTNTTAYVMAEKYKIQDKLPILIAEKMGPHFAVGDTCYSWSEDTKVYNRDGKEIIARDNEVSILRKTDLNKAYFGCHTDITIPYDELEHIVVITKEDKKIPIIENGRFVLPGTEELNNPFAEE